MRLEWLEDILAVSEMGSFNAAAEARFLTPSAFTRRIRTIEQTLGCELFDRSKKPIVLKEHIKNNLGEIREATTTLKRVQSLMSEPEGISAPRITFICQHALTALAAPRILMLPALGDDPNVRVKSGRRDVCILELIKREADFAILFEAHGSRSDIGTKYCTRLPLGSEIFIPVIKAGYSKDLDSGVMPDRLPMIGYPSSVFLGEVLQRVLKDRPKDDLQLVTLAETGLSLAIVEFVRSGVGLGWVPKSLVEQELENGTLVSLEETLPAFELNVMLLRTENELSRQAEDFWTQMETEGDKPGGVQLISTP